MADITQHQSNMSTKTLIIGDSGCAKTGSLAALAEVGYQLRIVDLDNGLDVLKSYLTSPKSPYVQRCPGIAKNVKFITLTDKMKNVNGMMHPVSATVWPRAMSMMTHWKDGAEDLGKIADWGPQDILVLDSLSFLSTAAMNFHLSLQGALGKPRSGYEFQRDIGSAQNLIRQFLDLVFDSNLRCNIIVSSHLTLVTESGGSPNARPAEGQAQAPREPSSGYPSAVGRALSPHIPRWFNNMLIYKTTGAGTAVQRKIYTTPQVVGGSVVLAKSSAPMNVQDSYPVSTGLADYFKAVRGEPAKAA